MKAYDKEISDKALTLLKQNRGPKDVSKRLNVPYSTVEKWATAWRKDGSLTSYVRAGWQSTNQARNLSNGYYVSIRKRYATMKYLDETNNREFGFTGQIESLPYYLDKDGNPRPCAYCNKQAPDGTVWGLDRLESSKGHVPGNLVPCCGSHEEGAQLSCQASKSKYSLFGWMEMNMSRANGKPVGDLLVTSRVRQIQEFAQQLNTL